MKPYLESDGSLFTKYIDPESGITSYLLDRRVAPVQQGFYFVNTGFSPSQRHLWFYTAFPPSGTMTRGRTLAVVDFEASSVVQFPDTQFHECSPLVVEDGVYWASDRGIWFRTPRPQEPAQLVAPYPEQWFGERSIRYVSTHLTLSTDGAELFLDAWVGDRFFAGSINRASGEFCLWKEFDRFYNHGQFCPNDGNLALVAQENMVDPATGNKLRYDNRLWLLQRSGHHRPVFEQDIRVTHEWWDADGVHFYALNQQEQLGGPAILRFHKDTLVWERWLPGMFWHAHDWDHGRWFVADRHPWTDFYRNCPSQVLFLDRESGHQTAIVSRNPGIFLPGGPYHIDPHPRFSPDGSVITHTTTVRGQVDLALTLTEDVRPALPGLSRGTPWFQA